MIDIDKIESLAKAATPGPWRGDRFDGTVKYDIVAGDYPNGAYTIICHGDNGNACDGGYGFTSAENEAYVLAANPDTILALVAEVRRLREDAERYRWLRDKTIQDKRKAPVGIVLSILDGRHNHCGWVVTYGADADKAIDAARKEKS